MDKTQQKLDFVVIGTPKSGTTYTYQLLKEHPQIAISSPKDGISGGFFKPNELEKTKKRIIKQINRKKGASVRGEYKEGYVLFPESADLMKQNNPDMKIVVCVRNPYERAYSNYSHRALLDDFTSLEDPRDFRHIIESGFYYKNLKPFFEKFNKEQILILYFEDLKNNPQNYQKKLYGFLGVTAAFIPKSQGRQINNTRFKGTLIGKFIHKLLIPIIDIIGFGKIVRSSNYFSSLFHKFTNFIGKRAKQKINILTEKEFIKKIEGIYDEDLLKLKEEYNIEI